uniref:Uncharacterized protein n=1 Tax=Panagrolaimus sp. PS1159 TaxID=55785 RepID=A0AC35GGW4_9BILA
MPKPYTYNGSSNIPRRPGYEGMVGIYNEQKIMAAGMINVKSNFFKRTTGPPEILNATWSKYHYPRANVVAKNRIIDNSVIELD